jgi:hypothetical protein
MRLCGRCDDRIIKFRDSDSDRRGSAGLIVVVAPRPVGAGPFCEAVCTAFRQGDTHLTISFEEDFCEYMEQILNFTTKFDIMAGVLIPSDST